MTKYVGKSMKRVEDPRFIQGKGACNRTETLLSHNKVAKLHKLIEIRIKMDKWTKQKKS